MREEILRKLVKEVKTIVGSDYKVVTKEIIKNNNVKLNAIIITAEIQTMTPTIYVDNYIEKIASGETNVEKAATEIAELYHQYSKPDLDIDISELQSKAFILGNVCYQLVNTEKNKERLQNLPHKEVLDLSAIYRVKINEEASYVVNADMLKIAGLTTQELDEAAKENTKKDGFRISTIQEILFPSGISDGIENGIQDIYVLTNTSGNNGANILLYKEKLKELADKICSDFYILPSSIHEVLALPVRDADDSEALLDMVYSINQTEVDDEEVLSNCVYIYRKDEEKLNIANK